MAAALPASLKTAEIARFTNRAAQLEKVKPVIWYWSSYHVLNQILEKGLHTADSESLAYTTKLMDDVEQFKAQNATNDAVVDDVAGKAYVEQFGLQTFTRADNAVRADKATRQTADTFQAAGTFFDLLSIWGPLEPEIAAKSKYAKYHALRIAKAIKAGEDPNLSNPKQQPEPEEVLPPLDPNDAEVQALEGGITGEKQPSVADVVDETDRLQAQLARTSSLDQSLHPSRDPSAVRQQRQPSVVEIPDEASRDHSNHAQQSLRDESLHPSRAPSLPRAPSVSQSTGEAVSPLAAQDAASFYGANVPADVSPIEPSTERKPSIGGNYFPVVSQTQPQEQTSVPSMPPVLGSGTAPTSYVSQNTPTISQPPQAPPAFAPQSQPSIQTPISPTFIGSAPVTQGNSVPPFISNQPNHAPPNFPPQQSPQPSIPQAPMHHYQQPPMQNPAGSPPPMQYYQTQPVPTQGPIHVSPPPVPAPVPPPTNTVLDEEALMKAQKHARWAISALNFEDVQTAVRELEGALRVLGAR